jgi:hypothetical protein
MKLPMSSPIVILITRTVRERRLRAVKFTALTVFATAAEVALVVIR